MSESALLVKMFVACTASGASSDELIVLVPEPMCIATTVPVSAHAAKNRAQTARLLWFVLLALVVVIVLARMGMVSIQQLKDFRARKLDSILETWGPDYPDPNTNSSTFAENPNNSDEAKATGYLAWRKSLYQKQEIGRAHV